MQTFSTSFVYQGRLRRRFSLSLYPIFSRASPLIFIAGATNGKGDTGNELEKITMDQTLSSSSSSLGFFFFNLFSSR